MGVILIQIATAPSHFSLRPRLWARPHYDCILEATGGRRLFWKHTHTSNLWPFACYTCVLPLRYTPTQETVLGRKINDEQEPLTRNGSGGEERRPVRETRSWDPFTREGKARTKALGGRSLGTVMEGGGVQQGGQGQEFFGCQPCNFFFLSSGGRRKGETFSIVCF